MTHLLRLLALLVVLAGWTLLPAQVWTPDSLPGYERRTVWQPDDYSGAVCTTIVRHTSRPAARTAVLYLHGFNDYFFQSQLGDSVTAHGYGFYAIDLRKYGRSWRQGQQICEVRDLREYFPDIDSALTVIGADGYDSVCFMGHSTGGLVMTYYLALLEKERPQVCGLILNSPFLDMNLPAFQENILLPVVSALRFLNIKFRQSGSNAYAQSLLRRYHGEWDYDTTLKGETSPVVTSRWTSAIYRAQRRVQRRARLSLPILLLHSSRTVGGSDWTPDFGRGDAVLDVADISKYGRRLGPDVTEVVVEDGLHDLILSRKDVRDGVYRDIFSWLGRHGW